MRIELKALILASWREGYNQGWRFSPARPGLWGALLHVLLAALVLWRMNDWSSRLPFGTPLLLDFLEAWLLAFLSVLMRGRERLYTGPLVTLIHLSPTPAQAVVLAQVIAGLPGRAWSAVLFALALFPALPAEVGPWGVPVLWVAALLGGLLGHLSGLVGLMGLVRRWPAALVAIPAVAMVLFLGMVYAVIYLLTVGLGQMALPADGVPGQEEVATAELALMLLLSLPGLLMLAGLLRRRGAGGEAYREGWLAAMELADRRSRPLRSRWPGLVRGPAGAIQALVWLQAARNWFSLVRLALLAGGLLLPLLIDGSLRTLSGDEARLLFVGMGLVMAIFNYGEQAAALFSADGERMALVALAGVTPRQLLAGKWLGALPLPWAAGLITLVWSLAGGCSPAVALGLGGVSLAIALGSLTWLVGAAALDAAPRSAGLQVESEQLAAALEQAPTRPGGVIGLAGAAVLAGAALWLYVHAPAWLAALAVLPLGAAVGGWYWLGRLLRMGVEG